MDNLMMINFFKDLYDQYVDSIQEEHLNKENLSRQLKELCRKQHRDFLTKKKTVKKHRLKINLSKLLCMILLLWNTKFVIKMMITSLLN